jgi:hypothetical protein
LPELQEPQESKNDSNAAEPEPEPGQGVKGEDDQLLATVMRVLQKLQKKYSQLDPAEQDKVRVLVVIL